MSEPKVLFVKQFLAVLMSENKLSIPINDEKFKKGVASMADYFEKHKERFGPKAEQLELLFLKYSTRGDYDQFAKIIENFNGRILSLENPHYIRANLKMESDYVSELLGNTELGIEPPEFKKAVACFISGAGLS